MGRPAWTLSESGQLRAAETLGREAYARAGDSFGTDDRRTLAIGYTLASTLAGLDHRADADALFADLAERARRVLGPEDPDTLIILSRMAAGSHSTVQKTRDHFRKRYSRRAAESSELAIRTR